MRFDEKYCHSDKINSAIVSDILDYIIVPYGGTNDLCDFIEHCFRLELYDKEKKNKIFSKICKVASKKYKLMKEDENNKDPLYIYENCIYEEPHTIIETFCDELCNDFLWEYNQNVELNLIEIIHNVAKLKGMGIFNLFDILLQYIYHNIISITASRFGLGVSIDLGHSISILAGNAIKLHSQYKLINNTIKKIYKNYKTRQFKNILLQYQLQDITDDIVKYLI